MPFPLGWGIPLPGSSGRLLSHPAPSKLGSVKRGAVQSKGCAPRRHAGGAASGANHRRPSRQVPEGQRCVLAATGPGVTGRMAHVAESAGRCCSPTGRYTGSSGGGGGRRDWLAWLDGGTACSCPGLSKTLELPLGCFWDALVCRLSPDCFTDNSYGPD